MPRSINDLGETLLAQLNEIATGGDKTIKPSPNDFIAWCQPGIPFDEKDFDFAAKGLGSGTTAEEEKLLTQQALNFAMTVDFIPDTSGLYKDDAQQAIFRTSQGRLSHVYGEILRTARVAKHELTEAEQAKIDKFRNLMFETKEITNPVTDEVSEVTRAGKVIRAYDEAQGEYVKAATIYKGAFTNAQGATGPEGKSAVDHWRNMGQILKMGVDSAEKRWVSQGFRNEVDDMNAFIERATNRSLRKWFDQLSNYHKNAFLTGLNVGEQFYYASVIPGNFANSDGWTNYSVYHDEKSSKVSMKRKSWKAGGSFGWGLFSVGGGGSGSKVEHHSEFEVSKFSMEFELAQVLISRPGFYPMMFRNRGWKLDAGSGWQMAKMPSDGGERPDGELVGYATQILFAKNIKITSDEFASEYDKVVKEVKGGGSVGWGPFKLKGGYANREEERSYEMERDGSSLVSKGMQIIGFVNTRIPKAPNPDPQLKDDDFE